MAEMPTAHDWEDFRDRWESAAGLPASRIKVVVDALRRRDEIAREARTAEAAVQALSKRIGQRIADGELDFLEGLVEHQRLGAYLQQPSWSNRTPLGPGLRDAARGACLRRARSHLEEHGTELAEIARAKGGASAHAVTTWLEHFGFAPSENPRSEEAQAPTPGAKRAALWIGG